jgi:hypothetical protein
MKPTALVVRSATAALFLGLPVVLGLLGGCQPPPMAKPKAIPSEAEFNAKKETAGEKLKEAGEKISEAAEATGEAAKAAVERGVQKTEEAAGQLKEKAVEEGAVLNKALQDAKQDIQNGNSK